LSCSAPRLVMGMVAMFVFGNKAKPPAVADRRFM
jgi:hypothetical protein